MSPVCKKCGNKNSNSSMFCSNCNTPLYDLNQISRRLIDKQKHLELKHQLEINALREDISLLQANLELKQKSDYNTESVIPVERNMVEKELQPTKLIPEEKIFNTDIPVTGSLISEKNIQNTNTTPKSFKKERKPFKSIFETIKPLYDGLEFVEKIYKKYKEEDKLPIFFMTLTGIIAILFGFGYLMQNTFKLLKEYETIAKISIGFVSAISVIIIGSRLYKKGETYTEYASALISLGIILNYLMIYFLSDLNQFPTLSSAITGFSLIIANTLTAIIISLRFETKIVSVLFLIGGALTPFYLNSTEDGSLYYFYLWMLTAGTIFVASRIKWDSLKHISFVVSAFLIEFMVFNYSPASSTFLIIYHLFAYLFVYASLFSKSKIKQNLNKSEVFTICGAIAFFIYNLYSIDNTLLTGYIYVGNASFIALIAAIAWVKLSKEVKFSLITIVSVFIALAVPALFKFSSIGVVWAIESVLLIMLGFYFSLSSVRKEGFILLALSTLKILYTFDTFYYTWGEILWHDGFINFISIGIIYIFLWIVLNRHKDSLSNTELVIQKFFKSITPIWLSSAYMVILYHTIGLWSLNMAIVPLIGLIIWSDKFRCKSSYITSVFHLLFFIIAFIISSIEVFSLHFSDQLLFAKISMSELLLCLWGIKFLHTKVMKNNVVSLSISQNLRIVFFVILPLIPISIVKRHAIEYIDVAFWFSVTVCYLFYKTLKFRILFYEMFTILFIAFIVALLKSNITGLSSAIFTLLLIAVAEKSYCEKFFKESKFKIFLSLIPNTIFLLISVLTGILLNSINIPFAIYSTLSFATVLFKNRAYIIKNISGIIIIIGALSNLLVMPLLVLETSNLILSVIFLNMLLFAYILNNKKRWYIHIKSNIKWQIEFTLFQIQAILLYIFTLYHFEIDPYGPVLSILLTLHAIVLLFISLKNRISVSKKISFVIFAIALLKVIFKDTVDFSLTEKIFVFITLGIILLLSAYAYTIIKKRYESVKIN